MNRLNKYDRRPIAVTPGHFISFGIDFVSPPVTHINNTIMLTKSKEEQKGRDWVIDQLTNNIDCPEAARSSKDALFSLLANAMMYHPHPQCLKDDASAVWQVYETVSVIEKILEGGKGE